MRAAFVFVLAVCLAACSPSNPRQATKGPRLAASLAANWAATAPARQAVFSHDGKLLATSDASGLLTIREAGSWRPLAQLRHSGGATSIAFGAGGRHLFSGGYDGTIREWDLGSRAV